MTLHLRGRDLGLRDLTAWRVITSGKKGPRPSVATVLRMLRDHGRQTPA
ncbi:unnamed protein product [[Actinomadura] parvosata subsp. kistnae]|nr:hypothetical protein [Nonomuraea sp. ATCC 55076]SPL88675.1 unnamed protein product [Actinomadura parvosata subsp. kistnae]